VSGNGASVGGDVGVGRISTGVAGTAGVAGVAGVAAFAVGAQCTSTGIARVAGVAAFGVAPAVGPLFSFDCGGRFTGFAGDVAPAVGSTGKALLLVSGMGRFADSGEFVVVFTGKLLVFGGAVGTAGRTSSEAVGGEGEVCFGRESAVVSLPTTVGVAVMARRTSNKVARFTRNAAVESPFAVAALVMGATAVEGAAVVSGGRLVKLAASAPEAASGVESSSGCASVGCSPGCSSCDLGSAGPFCGSRLSNGSVAMAAEDSAGAVAVGVPEADGAAEALGMVIVVRFWYRFAPGEAARICERRAPKACRRCPWPWPSPGRSSRRCRASLTRES